MISININISRGLFFGKIVLITEDGAIIVTEAGRGIEREFLIPGAIFIPLGSDGLITADGDTFRVQEA